MMSPECLLVAHAPPPRYDLQRTGRIRYRIGRFGRPKLELEYIQRTLSGTPPPPGQDARVLSERTIWLDMARDDVDWLMRMGIFTSEE